MFFFSAGCRRSCFQVEISISFGQFMEFIGALGGSWPANQKDINNENLYGPRNYYAVFVLRR